MLSVTEKLPQILLQKPVKIADPVQPFRVNDHAESWIHQEGAASGSRFQIATINRDDDFEIAEGLSLQAIKTLGDEIGALIDGQSHSNTRSQLQLLGAILASGHDSLGADVGEVGCHSKLSGIDGVKAAYGSDADLVSTM